MLKHRYNNLSESISDFDRMLDGMNKTQPLERKVEEDLLDLFRDEQALVRLEQQIEHVHRAIYGSGMPISEAESESIRKMHAHAAAMYNETADKAMERILARRKELGQMAHDVRTASLKRMQDFHDKLRRNADKHGALAKPASSEKKVVNDSVNESVRPKMGSGMAVFRRLAGIDEAIQMPRDPGVLGTTRFNAEYEKMAQPFDEGLPDIKDATVNKPKKLGLPGQALAMDANHPAVKKRDELEKASWGKAPQGVRPVSRSGRSFSVESTVDEARSKEQQDAGQDAMAKREVARGAQFDYGPKAPKSDDKAERRSEVRAAMAHRGAGDRLADRASIPGGKYFTKKGGGWDAKGIEARKKDLLDRSKKRRSGEDPGSDDVG